MGAQGIVLSKASKQAACREIGHSLCKQLHRLKVRAGVKLDGNVWCKSPKAGTIEIGCYKIADVPLNVVASQIKQWAMGSLTPQHLARIVTQEWLVAHILGVDSMPAKKATTVLDDEMRFRDKLDKEGVDLFKEKAAIEAETGAKVAAWKYSD